MPSFFALHRPSVAFVVTGLLTVAIVLTISAFRRIDRLAAVLLVPYLCWVVYVAYLTGGYWWLNGA